MVWLSKQPSWTNARDVQISTRSFGLKSNAVLIPGEEDDDPSARVSGDRRLSYIPSYASSHSFWYKRRWCRVRRLQKEGTQWYKTKEEYLELWYVASFIILLLLLMVCMSSVSLLGITKS